MPHLHAARETSRRWAWRAGRVAGIPIYIHFTLFVLLAWIAWMSIRSGGAVGTQLLFAIGLFGSVLIHEVGHALTARAFGIRASEIVLYPFGGVSRLQSMGRPTEEFWISLAGPLTNLVLAAVLFLVQGIGHAGVLWTSPGAGPPPVLQGLLSANLILALFNLVPAFPMDGGRVIRALLARRVGMVRATDVAANVGQAFAVLMGVIALFTGQFILVMIAVFVFFAAGQERVMQRSLALLSGHRVKDAMITRFETLRESDTLGHAADRTLAAQQLNFPVASGERITRLLTRALLVRGLADLGPEALVGEAASPTFVRLAPDDSLRDALERMREASERAALVFDPIGWNLRGILTEESLREFFHVRTPRPRADRRKRSDSPSGT